MVIEIDFNSDEAIYVQLMNQIILGIATSRLQEGDTLPSVRQMADNIGINMHTVNKAYTLLKQEGFVSIDRRRGAIVAIDVDKIKALEEMKENLAKAVRKALAEESGVWSPDDISVSMEEIAPDKFEAETKAGFRKEELLIDSKYINFK